VPDSPSANSDRSAYKVLDELDRLEELLEEMDELGVSSRDEIEQRIAALEALIPDLDAEPDA
jgi:uncharacterized small protein (DUF1192 family)